MNIRNQTGARFGTLVRTSMALLLGLTLVALPETVDAQATIEGRRVVANETSREALEALLAELELIARDESVDQSSRLAASNQALLLRERLDVGDFLPGDQIALIVRQDQALTDTFSVERGQLLPLPYIDPVPMRGILRSELSDHLTEHISVVIREPDVRATALTRVSVLGQVVRSGFVLVDSDATLAEVITLAGGLGPGALIDELVIDRAGTNLWEASTFTAGPLEERTIDQLGMQSGDRLTIPGQPPQVQGRSFADWVIIAVGPLTAITALILANN